MSSLETARMHLARAALLLLLLAPCGVSGAPPAGSAASGPSAAAAGKPPAEAAAAEPSLAEMVGEAGAAEAQLLQIESGLITDAALEDMSAKLPEHLKGLEQAAAPARERIEVATQIRQLSDVENRWLDDQETLERWRSDTTGRALAIEDSLARVDQLIAVWDKARGQARELGAPAAVTERIGRTLQAARTSRERITAQRTEVLALQAKIAGGLAVVADVLEQTKRAQKAIRGGLLGTDSLPIWTALRLRGDLGELGGRAAQGIAHDFAAARDFALQRRQHLALHALLLGISLGVMLTLRRRAARWAEEDESAELSARVFARPYAAATLIAALCSPLLYAKAPSYFKALTMLVGLAATLRLIPPLLEAGAGLSFFALAGFFVADRIRDALAGAPLLARLVFEAELTAAIGVLIWLMRPRRMALLPRATRLMPVFVSALRLALALLSLALVSSALGYVALSRLLGEGVLTSAYVGLILYAGYRVLAGMISVSLGAPALQHLNLIRDHRSSTTRRLIGLTRFAALLIWVYFALGFFAIRDTLLGALASALSASFAVGQLEVSLGGIVAFALTLMVSIYLARFTRYVLDEDVLPRLSLPRGVPYAVSATVFYMVLLVGVFAALAAGGFDLSRFALLAGALGVGIGFGLQNIVNNFVSGLILLFERPIKTGDTIEIGQLIGEVRRIGIRSSTVRTWEGAEVIVPNANLVSDQVVNWTLSDRHRRIDVGVGVKYGTDPERVIELLLAVAKTDDRVLDQPEPNALFLGFGNSSLDFRLRAWTSQFSRWVAIRSELTVEMNRKLAEAGIEIPFPQRDLHLKSVAEELRDPKV